MDCFRSLLSRNLQVRIRISESSRRIPNVVHTGQKCLKYFFLAGGFLIESTNSALEARKAINTIDLNARAQLSCLPKPAANTCFLTADLSISLQPAHTFIQPSDPRPVSMHIQPSAWRQTLDLGRSTHKQTHGSSSEPCRYLLRSHFRRNGAQRALSSTADGASFSDSPKKKGSPKKRRPATPPNFDSELTPDIFTQSAEISKSETSQLVCGDVENWANEGDTDVSASVTNAEPIHDQILPHLSGSTARRNIKSVLQENVYWEELMETVDRPSARDMLPRLKPMLPMGVDREAKGVGSLFNYYVSVRQRHPRKIVLSRVGDFYEAFGYDAVLLVQVSRACGLPACSSSSRIARHIVHNLHLA